MLLRIGPFAGPEVKFFDGVGASEVTWLKSKLNWSISAAAAPLRGPAVRVPENLPVHRPEVIAQLASELSAVSDALRYRDNFARLLPQRIATLTTEVESRNHEAAVATLLSLNVGSTMVGAPRLQYVVAQCLADVRGGRSTACLPTLNRESERFLSYLAESSETGHPTRR
ncbi:hypothetical protein [Arthrobacter sp. D2-10]